MFRIMLPACIALALPANAQEGLSVEEIAARLERQRAAVQANVADLGQSRSLTGRAECSGEMINGACRGLTLLTPDTAASAAAAGTTAEETIPLAVFDDSLRLDITVNFDFDSAALRDDQKSKLANMCEAMKRSDVNLFRILGHTDASGAEDYNQRLSLLRAEEVVRFLNENCGISADRMQAIGMGERILAVPESPGADANRRVEFQAIS